MTKGDMWLLTVDTALKGCNVALSLNGKVMQSVELDEGITHSSRVLKSVNAVMQAQGLSLNQLNGFGVTIGPGSFTGLRIGLSTVKGLALALNKPVAGLCVLQALAMQAGNPQQLDITVILDGAKQEVFMRRYKPAGPTLTTTGGYLNMGYAQAAQSLAPNTVITGNGVNLLLPFIDDNRLNDISISPKDTWKPTNATLSQMAHAIFAAGGAVNGGAVVPNYIRKSDAELNLGCP